MVQPQLLPIHTQADIEHARREARGLAESVGLGRDEAEMVALAVSELAANLHRYALDGRIVLAPVTDAGRAGVQVESHDNGPGIVDIDLAMRDGYSTGGGLGSGLPAVHRLMDEFDISSSSKGTTVTARKWTTSPNR